jgi:hypothetical protein
VMGSSGTQYNEGAAALVTCQSARAASVMRFD